MLLELKVDNFAIISSLLFSPSGGLNVLSGETGAGKSLVADALASLILGQTGDEFVKSGAESAKISGLFQTKDARQKQIDNLLQSKGIAPEPDGQIILSCEIKKAGRSSFRINSESCSRSLMQEVGSLLADIHGQSDHLSLLNPHKHLQILDTFSGTTEQAAKFAAGYKTLKEHIEKYRLIQANINERVSQAEFLTFQLNEIKQAKLKEGEEDELSARQKVLSQAESIKNSCFEARGALSGDGFGTSAESNVAAASALIERLSQKDPSLKELAQRLKEASLEISDCAQSISDYADSLEFSPQALEDTENRLSVIRSLKRKHGGDVASVIQKAEEIEKQLCLLSTSEEDLSALKGQIKESLTLLGSLGEELLKARQKGASRLQGAVETELADLNMASVRFRADFSIEESSNGLPFSDGKRYAYSEDGVGNLQFVAQTNLGEEFKALNKIASTGEMSRFTLALKSALAESEQTPTLVFDEIDIGIGARSGHILGRKIYNISRSRQVICVTHLAQIAAYADDHFSVRKESNDGFTQSNLHHLKCNEIIEELGTMLSGLQSATKEQAAKELINTVEDYKKGIVKLF